MIGGSPATSASSWAGPRSGATSTATQNFEVRLTCDSHSYSEARCNAILRNFDAWYEAFDIQQGDAMYLVPEERVKIW